MNQLIKIATTLSLLLSLQVFSSQNSGGYQKLFVGPSVITLQKGSIYFSNFAGTIASDIGYQINPIIGVGLHIDLDLASVDKGFFGLTSFKVGPSIYPVDNFYITPSAGLLLLISENFIDDVFIKSGLSYGIGTDLTTGYNFQMSDNFSIGPAGRFAFNRAGGANAWVYGVSVNMRFGK